MKTPRQLSTWPHGTKTTFAAICGHPKKQRVPARDGRIYIRCAECGAVLYAEPRDPKR